MGFKINRELGTLPCDIEDSVLRVYFFDDVVKTVELDIPANIKFSKQINFVNTDLNNVLAFLSNDSYVIIVRFDGTITLTTKNFRVLKNSRIRNNDDLVTKVEILRCGHLNLRGGWSPGLLCLSDKFRFISSPDIPVSILLPYKDETSDLIELYARKYDSVNTVHITDMTSSKLWAEFGNGEYVQMSKVEYITGTGFITGVSI